MAKWKCVSKKCPERDKCKIMGHPDSDLPSRCPPYMKKVVQRPEWEYED